MNFLEVIFMVCMIENATVCEQKHVAVDQQMSLTTCALCAMPTLARWAGDNPGWTIVSWQCDYSGTRDEPVASLAGKALAFTMPEPNQ
jgi:hypothetical protein